MRGGKLEQTESVFYVDISLLMPNSYQPRKAYNEESLKELAASIKEYGILNPILVIQKGNSYEIISGERRMRAAKMAGLTKVPVLVKNFEESKLKELALIENIQRENMSPIEEAQAYKDVISAKEISEQQLGEMVGKTPTTISNKLKLLALPQNIQDALMKRRISERHAKSLLSITDEAKQKELLERVINERLSVKELDEIINEKTVTEEEIKSAISDIMKSLNISDEEKKEEKESDNMNNGNFFPNLNPNQNANDASLNSMNMQAINPMPQAPSMPEPNPIPNFGINPSVAPAPAAPEVAPMPEVASQPVIPEPVVMPAPEPMNNAPQPSMADIPLFTEPTPAAPAPVVPEIAPMPEVASQPIASAPAADLPLFNTENNETMEPTPVAPEMNYQVPVEEPTEDKYDQLIEFLNDNDIDYKAYSNEINKCIIIEF